MANSALIDNVARFPVATLAQFEAAPARLNDESKQTLESIAKIWVREGLRARVIALTEHSVNDRTRYAILAKCIRTTGQRSAGVSLH
jgi:hypothetical protein